MIISVNWLKKFIDIDLPIDQLVTLIGARLVEIEAMTELGPKYDNVLVARIVTCDPLEGSDHLSIVKLDDGGKVADVARDETGLVQVVCGAPNVRAGLLVAWLPPGSTVPATYDGAEPLVLASKQLRGVISNGMLASAKELDLFDDHTGILEIDKQLAVGTHFVTAYGLDDYLLDIENKSLTHRPDTFGIIGFAREVAAIQGKPFITPQWLVNVNPIFSLKDAPIVAPAVSIDNPELSARYQAVVLSGVDGTRQSPLEIQTYLARVGVRPINAVVDVTNYLMMLTGQPLHAFDYDKLVAISGGKADIHVRAARQGETLELLDGRTLSLDSEDIVIASGDVAVGLAGAMGGASTVIDNSTKNIIIESATFNLYNLRATQMRHGIFSEAITRFTKGQPADLTAPVLADAVRLLGEWSGAKAVSGVGEAIGSETKIAPIELSASRVGNILGTSLGVADIEKLLRSIEFAVEVNGDSLMVEAPYWRSDIKIAEDVIEEIGRLNGFDSIRPTLPLRDFRAVLPSGFDVLRTRLRQLLVRAGADEVLTYSFVHGDVLKKAGQKLENSYRITNSISPDLQYYRQTLTPSLLGMIHPNIKQGYDNFAIFEVNKTHPKSYGLTGDGVPVEVDMIALTVTNNKAQPSAAYYQAKKLLDFMAQGLGLDLRYAPIEENPSAALSSPFEQHCSAIVRDSSDALIGVVGEYKSSVSQAFKLPSYTAGFEIETVKLLEAVQRLENSYRPLSRYPSSARDICFQVSSDTSYGQVIDAVATALHDIKLETDILPVDIYQPAEALTKNITIRVRLTSHLKTLTADEVKQVIERMSGRVTAELQAVVV